VDLDLECESVALALGFRSTDLTPKPAGTTPGLGPEAEPCFFRICSGGSAF